MPDFTVIIPSHAGLELGFEILFQKLRGAAEIFFLSFAI
jgi:hypothetical protein